MANVPTELVKPIISSLLENLETFFKSNFSNQIV